MRHAAQLAVLVAVLDVSNSDSVPPSPPGCAALAQGWQPLCSRGRTYANWHALYCAEPDLALAPSGWLFGECERRALTSAADDAHADDAHGKHVHGAYLVIFPFSALGVGLLTEWALKVYGSRCRSTKCGLALKVPLDQVPYTVALFLEGILVAWVDHKSRHGLGIFSESLRMWLNIDPHVMLYAFLPLLLFGDAMSLNIHHLRQKIGQCLLLAVPGVLFGTAALGYLAQALFPAWNANLAFTFGAITAATDPVAVVALLKDLGASPGLTMIITGESLMNDGTAMVVYQVFLLTALGHKDAPEGFVGALLLFVKMAFGGVALGMVFGGVALGLLSLVHQRGVSAHSGTTWQFSITLIVAYISFFVGEQVLKVSGVLCTVTAALMIAMYGNPLFGDHEAMHRVWHTLEFIGNTVIFILAGALVGGTMVKFGLVMYLKLLAVYLGALVARAAMLTLFWPLLQRWELMDQYSAITKSDGLVIAWGGLRGAVGLALGIAVKKECEDKHHYFPDKLCDEDDGEELLFYVGGLAMLTLVVNGTLSGALLAKLGMTERSPASKYLDPHLSGKMARACQKAFKDSQEHIDHIGLPDKLRRQVILHLSDRVREYSTCLRDADELIRCEETPKAADSYAETSELTLARSVFVRCVRECYMEMIEVGMLPQGSQAARILLSSCEIAADQGHVAEKLVLWPGSVEKFCTGHIETNGTWGEQLLVRCSRWFKLTKLNHAMGFHSYDLGSYLHYHAQEQAVYTLLAFLYAYEEAREHVKEFFQGPSAAQLKKLDEELDKDVKLAAEALGKIDYELICLVCSKLSATVVIDKQFHELNKHLKAGLITSKDAEEHIADIVRDIAKLDHTKSQHLKHFISKQYSAHGSSLGFGQAGGGPKVSQISPHQTEINGADESAEAKSHEPNSSEAGGEMALQEIVSPTSASAMLPRHEA